MIKFHEYKAYYVRNGRTINGLPGRTRPLSDSELQKKYAKFTRTLKKAEDKKIVTGQKKIITRKVDEKWEETKIESRKLYGKKCLLMSQLSGVEIDTLLQNSGGLHQTIDPAHVFGKGAHPHMKYVADNVVPLNRFSHSMLDQQKDPITGKPISRKELDEYWEFIVGKEVYESLKDLSQK